MTQKHSPEYFPGREPDDADCAAVLASWGEQAQHYLKLGNTHYNNYLSLCSRPDLESAITHYQRALELDPNLSEGYVKLASALWDKGEIPVEKAIDYCQTALTLNPAVAEANLFLGYFLKKAGKIEEAIDHFKVAVEKSSLHSSKPRIALGVGLLHQASLNRELPTVERLNLTCQGLAHFSLGCLLLPTDQATFKHFQSALFKDLQVYSLMGLGKSFQCCGLKGVSSGIYKWAAEILPEESIFPHLLGDLYRTQKNTQTAIGYYRQALAVDPGNAAVHKKLGLSFFETQDMENAAVSLEKVLHADDNDFDTLYHLGRVYSDRKDYIRALYYFKEALNRSPNNPYIHSHMAYLLFKLQDFDGAIQEYRVAVTHGEDDVWTATVAQTLGVVYYQIKNDLEAAIAMFQLAFQLDPTNLDSMAMLADLYFEQGNLEAAIGSYKYILTYEPDNAECYSYMGYLLWQMDRNEEAIDAYLTAIRLDKKNHIAYNNLGVIYLDEQSRHRQALEMFQKALSLNPAYTLACFNMGRVQEALGEYVLAANAYSEALGLNAENPELEDKEIMERLDSLFKV